MTAAEALRRRHRATALTFFLAVAALFVACAETESATRVEPALATAPTSFGTWEPIAKAPIPPRPFASTSWTGSQVVFWAGSSLERGNAYSDGALYDPVTDSWETMVVPGWGHPGLTGTFFDAELFAVAKGGGTRIDPVAGEWNDLPRVDGMFLATLIASDEAVWGLGPVPSEPTEIATARYDAVNDDWSENSVFAADDAQAPVIAGIAQLETDVVWTGSEIVVWGGRDGGIAYRPETDSWRTLLSPTLESGVIGGSVAVATDEGLALVVELEGDGGPAVGVALLGQSGWQWLNTRVPLADFESVTVARAGEWLVVFSADQNPVTIHLASGAWHRHDDSPIFGVQAPNTAWTGEALVVWGGAEAGDSAAGAIWTPPAG